MLQTLKNSFSIEKNGENDEINQMIRNCAKNEIEDCKI